MLLLKFLGLFWISNAFFKGLLDIKCFPKSIVLDIKCFCSQDDVKPHLPTDDLKLTDKQANVTSVRSRRSSSQVELCSFASFFFQCFIKIIQLCYVCNNIQLHKLFYQVTTTYTFYITLLDFPFHLFTSLTFYFHACRWAFAGVWL